MTQDTLINSIQTKLNLLNSEANWQDVLYPWLRTELTYTSNRYLEALENSTEKDTNFFLDSLLKQYDQNLEEYLRTFEG